MSGEHTYMNGAEARSVFRQSQDSLPMRLLIKGFIRATGFMPVWLLRAAGIPFVFLFIMLSLSNFLFIARNMGIIRPGANVFKRFFMAFALYFNYADYLIDLFHLSHDPSRIESYDVEVVGIEHIQNALKTGKGIIFLTTHMGNWEIGGSVVDRLDGMRRMHVAYSPDSSALLEHQRKSFRRNQAVSELPLENGAFLSLRMLRALEAGEILGIQGDRLLFDKGVAVEFFGKTARFPKGPLKLALLSNAVVLPIFMPLTGYKSYSVIVEPPVELDAGLEITENMSRITKIFEKFISRYPAQWFNFTPFWEKETQR